MKSRLYRSAIWYAKHEWKVFPLRPGTKEPFQGIGVYQGTLDLDVINKWWSQWPQANIGLSCGGSGVIALDADSYKDVYDGEKLLDPLDEETVTNLTGGGGTHLLYQMPEGKTLGNAKSGLPSGIDIRGYGGYVVLPPSVHPNGTLYQWESNYGPHEIALLPLPELLEIILDKAQLSCGAPVFLPDITTPKPTLSNWFLSRGIRDLITETPIKGGRSEADQSVITALVRLAASDTDILSVFQHYPIGAEGKFAEKGGQGMRYLAHSIEKARAFYAAAMEESIQERTAEFLQTVAI